MSNEEPIPVAVIGAGNMGANHIRVYDELPEADLVEVVEPDPERATEVREKYDVQVLNSVDEIEQAVAATVAVPNELHRATAERIIEQGLDVLVEKPLAMTVDDAEAIVETAEEHGAILQVGHIERFNPAIAILEEIIADEEVIAIEAHRLGPFNEQLSEESVVFDLMIHDIGVINTLVSGEIAHLDSVGVRSRSEALDHAVSHLHFKGDVLGTATASHVTHGKVRTLDIVTEDAYINLDYQDQSIQIQRRGVGCLTHLDDRAGYRTETVTENPLVHTREPLKLELEHFLSCVRNENTPKVDGLQGLQAVKIASEVVENIPYIE